jgi:DNA primase
VVCEGVTDACSFGPEAVALFGKTASTAQVRLLQSTWKSGAVIVLRDGDAADEGQELFDSLGAGVRAKALVRLPEGQDPGDFRQAQLRRLVFEAAQTQGVDLPWALAGSS